MKQNQVEISILFVFDQQKFLQEFEAEIGFYWIEEKNKRA
jgi:hypothetical protein